MIFRYIYSVIFTALMLVSVPLMSQERQLWSEVSHEQVDTEIPEHILKTACEFSEEQDAWVCSADVLSRFRRSESIVIEQRSHVRERLLLERQHISSQSCLSGIRLSSEQKDDDYRARYIREGHSAIDLVYQRGELLTFVPERLPCFEYLSDREADAFTIEIKDQNNEDIIRLRRTLTYSPIDFRALLKMNAPPAQTKVTIPWTSTTGGLLTAAGGIMLFEGLRRHGWTSDIQNTLGGAALLLGVGVPMLAYGLVHDIEQYRTNRAIEYRRKRYWEQVFEAE